MDQELLRYIERRPRGNPFAELNRIFDELPIGRQIKVANPNPSKDTWREYRKSLLTLKKGKR